MRLIDGLPTLLSTPWKVLCNQTSIHFISLIFFSKIMMKLLISEFKGQSTILILNDFWTLKNFTDTRHTDLSRSASPGLCYYCQFPVSFFFHLFLKILALIYFSRNSTSYSVTSKKKKRWNYYSSADWL